MNLDEILALTPDMPTLQDAMREAVERRDARIRAATLREAADIAGRFAYFGLDAGDAEECIRRMADEGEQP